MSDSNGIFYSAPPGYVLPRWPALYQPFTTPQYLYSPYQIWRFTVLWTVMFYSIFSLLAGLLYITSFSRKHLRLSLLAPIVYVVWGAFGAFMSATVVGYAIAAIYSAAFLRMSTFVPALFGALQTLILISTSLRTFQSMM